VLFSKTTNINSSYIFSNPGITTDPLPPQQRPFNTHENWVPVTTAWRVFRVRMEKRPPIWRKAANILTKQLRKAEININILTFYHPFLFRITFLLFMLLTAG
jgi:hypothetical protein